jgi:hypothetical protein
VGGKALLKLRNKLNKAARYKTSKQKTPVFLIATNISKEITAPQTPNHIHLILRQPYH